ncbi:DNA methylase [Candidatus Woesearchaeota archaeon CG10_big_fil_rev_8_21_14_0_10_30_7]|nr:MAG: DNA methylase [Candidatus Woesearchaeota archaeon CG10_big_fil_rev_8_21_14_0_10_30_7]
MRHFLTKKQLAIILSKLKVFESPKVSVEQYNTDSEIAATILWNSGITREFEDKVIVDLGAGTGILGLGALLLGADKVFFVESDGDSLEIAKKNHEMLKSEFNIGKAIFLNQKIEEFNEKCDFAIQNPPFGTKKEHADKEFLEKAFSLAPIIYTFHKASTDEFIKKIVDKNNFLIKNEWLFNFPIKKTQSFHKKPVKKILVKVYRLEKQNIY